ncbi:MAG TPA: M1 family metallopeptidase [Longimicrobiales bacterium]
MIRASLRALAAALLPLALLAPRAVRAQGDPAAEPAGDTSIFRALALPAPSQLRDASGRPGPAYWQQRADYRIQATLDTAARVVSGSETIHYGNESPDTLRFVWLQVDQNIYRPESLGSDVFPAGGRWGANNFKGGIDVRSARVGGTEVKPYIWDTLMRLDLPAPLPPHQAVDLQLTWSFPVPVHGSDRMGRQGRLYEIAQWYPRMAVYDDVRGWNTDPYLGQGEFYLEYGDFDVSLTVPADYVVAATGTLLNPEQVLTAAQRDRLKQAAGSATQVQIITPAEAGKPASRPTTSGTLTWHFTARNTRDFAWAGAPDFLWDATSKGGVLCNAYYQPFAAQPWRRGADYTCFAIDDFSRRWFRYPYPQATSVAGPVGGMEYPMFVMVSAMGGEQDIASTIFHEQGHEWFPMTVGSNERRYVWMDEGFNTFIDQWANDARFPGSSSFAANDRAYTMSLAMNMDQPLMTPADRITPMGLGFTGYQKPAMVLNLLRTVVLDSATFDLGFRTYTQRWAFRHPMPWDFFRTMQDVSGRDLSWFWREWIYTNDRLDQAVDTVVQIPAASGVHAQVRLLSRARAIMPVPLRLTLANGEKRDLTLPVEIWYGGNSYLFTADLPARITKVEIDPSGLLPDVNRRNNVWPAGS